MFFFIVLGYSKNHYLLQNTKSKEHTCPQYKVLKTISSGFHNETKKGKLSEVTNTLRLSLNKQDNSIHLKLFK